MFFFFYECLIISVHQVVDHEENYTILNNRVTISWSILVFHEKWKKNVSISWNEQIFMKRSISCGGYDMYTYNINSVKWKSGVVFEKLQHALKYRPLSIKTSL